MVLNIITNNTPCSTAWAASSFAGGGGGADLTGIVVGLSTNKNVPVNYTKSIRVIIKLLLDLLFFVPILSRLCNCRDINCISILY